MASRRVRGVLIAAGLVSIGLLPAPARTPTRSVPPLDYASATWAPAAPSNYKIAERPTNQPIDTIVIHDIEGSAIGAVLWFQDPRSGVSAHYVVDATEGKVWQQVREKDIGWHAGNRFVNARSVGIEHEGYAYRPGYYTPTLYESSAHLVRSITERHRIPRDRQHILGHHEVPHPSDPTRFGGASAHTDPGPYWDWDYYMTLVRNDARIASATFPTVLHPGEQAEAVVTLTNTGDDSWPAMVRPVNNRDLLARGPVYLGTAAGNASLFFGPGWTSPRLAAPPITGEAVPNTEARFVFPLTGPRNFGPSSEIFRLYKVPVMPRLPAAFGPTITATVRVEPWDILWDSAHPGFSAPKWTRGMADGRLIWTHKPDKAEKTPAFAQWKGSLPISGDWDISVRWTKGSGRTRKAVYEIVTANGPRIITVDQRNDGGKWRKLGRFRLEDPKAVRITLQTDSDVIVADSVRFAGPFPAENTK
jgi:N-acetyl-anhydromuramyl-L-alanine amidase AmpD